MTDKSYAKVGQRVKKSKLNPTGWEYTNQIPPDDIAVITFPGSDANNSRKANGFAKAIQNLLKNKKTPIYSVEYGFNGRNAVADRDALLNIYNQGTPEEIYRYARSEDPTYIPKYIYDIYSSIFAPRLRNEDGSKASIEKIAQRLNKLVFVNHCQGSTVAFQLERLLQADLKKLGYSKSVQSFLLKQVHNIHLAPVTPYGETQTTTYKFLSLTDEKVTSVNHERFEYIRKRKQEHLNFLANIKDHNPSQIKDKPFVMEFSVIRPTQNETIFAVNNFYPIEHHELYEDTQTDIEHCCDTFYDKEDEYRTKQGDKLSQTFIELFNHLVEHAHKNKDKYTELESIFNTKRFSNIIKSAEQNRHNLYKREIAIMRQNHNR